MITKAQWQAELHSCATTIRKIKGLPAPFVVGVRQNTMHIQSGHCRGSVSLEALDTDVCFPQVRGDSGAALVGTVEEVEAGVNEYRTVLSILQVMQDHTAGMKIAM